ncbi:MAG: AraC family transcriptional regulator [Bdellovibrio sp. CG10_big_fil_rev_8_21_14_0_10_47_8]|nr:MAG: AraC family transcriptional regulator [Bdellovibrio sp. CG10_big_fil_rev_8_21_14_0_10_47_8]
MDQPQIKKMFPFEIKIRYILLPLLGALLFFITYMVIYLGVFKPVTVEVREAGPFHMIFKEHTGAYHKIVPIIEEVEKWAQAQGLDCHLSFGEYLDRAQEVEESRLRSLGGCLVPEIPQSLPPDFQQKTLSERKYIVAVFNGSPGIGPFKVYSRVYNYATENRLVLEDNTLEVYEILQTPNSMITTYYFPIKQ